MHGPRGAAAKVAGALLLATIAGGLGSLPADATPPGVNGRIAFMRMDDNSHWQVWTANPDLSHRHLITSGSYDNGWPTWSPDGRKLAFESTRVAPDRDGELREVFLMSPTGGAVTQLTHVGGYSGTASWAPDGSFLVFSSDGASYPEKAGVYTIRPDGSGLRRIIPLPVGDTQATWLDAPRISPDGTRVAYTYFRGGTDTRNHFAGETSALWVANVDGTHRQRLTPWGQNVGDADWSPDGMHLAFETLGEHLGNWASVVTVNADGSGLRTLTQDRFTGIGEFYGQGNQQPLYLKSSYDPVYSPDGTTIMFTHTAYDAPPFVTDLQTMNPDGTQQTWVSTEGLEEHQVDWGTAPIE